MLILNEEKITWVLKEISKGFKLSPFEISIYFFIIISIGFVFTWFYRRERLKTRETNKKLAAKKFEKYIKEYKLTGADIDLLKLMAKNLKESFNLPLLIENRYIFNRCAKIVLKKDPSLSTRISSLRVKLGHIRTKADQLIHSTAEIPQYSEVELIITEDSTKKMVRGIIAEIKPDYLLVKLDQDHHKIDEKYVTVQFQNMAGIFIFKTRILKVKEAELYLQHTEEVKRVQRRRFFRKRVRIPAVISIEGSDEIYFTTIVDLSGGGAKVELDKEIKEGSIINLVFTLPGNYKISAKSRVISCGHGKIHLSFTEIKDSDREQIVKYIFRKL